MLLLALVAVAAEPPDIDAYGRLADAGRTSFPGCRRYQGTVEQVFDAGIFGKHASKYMVEGVLEDGVWTHLGFTPLVVDENFNVTFAEEKEGEGYPFLPPLLGRLAGAKAAEEGEKSAYEEIEDILRKSDVETEHLEPGPDGYALRRTFSVDNRWLREPLYNDLLVSFRGEVPFRWVLRVDDPVRLGAASKLRSLSTTLEKDEAGYAQREELHGEIRVGPLFWGMERTITWTGGAGCEG